MNNLVREPITPHKWRMHKWHHVDALVDMFGLVEQCSKCNLVMVHDLLSDHRHYGSHAILRDAQGHP